MWCTSLPLPSCAHQAQAGVDTSAHVMPDFSVLLQRPPHALITRLEEAVSGLLSAGSEVAALHGELARITASRSGVRCDTPLSAGYGAAESRDDESRVIGSRDSVLADGINAVFAGLTML